MQPHNLIALVTIAALFLFLATIVRVGRARATYGVIAPATSGHDQFDRHFRVQMNTLEQLVVFLPSIWLFAYYWSDPIAAGLGVLWIIGRIVYMTAYVAEPKTRSIGFGISGLAVLALMIGAVIGAVRQMLVTGGI